MIKPLPERLREVGDQIAAGGYPGTYCVLSRLVSGVMRDDELCGTRYRKYECVSDTLHTIADEIERDYVRAQCSPVSVATETGDCKYVLRGRHGGEKMVK